MTRMASLKRRHIRTGFNLPSFPCQRPDLFHGSRPRAVLRHLCLGKQCAATEALDTTVTARMKHSDGKIGDDFDGWAGACAEDVAKDY
ncbi:hypothetical protein VCV18_005676 [Metarhizium anisopliae]